MHLRVIVAFTRSRCSLSALPGFNLDLSNISLIVLTQCAGSAACFAAFHPLCARAAGYAIATVDAEEEDAAGAGGNIEAWGSGDSDREPGDANVAGADALHIASFSRRTSAQVHCRVCHLQRRTHLCCSTHTPDANCKIGCQWPTHLHDDNDRAAMLEGRGTGDSRKRKRRHRGQRVEGTTAGDGVRRLCFCPRHCHCAAALQPSVPQLAASPRGSRHMLGGQQQGPGDPIGDLSMIRLFAAVKQLCKVLFTINRHCIISPSAFHRSQPR